MELLFHRMNEKTLEVEISSTTMKKTGKQPGKRSF